MANSADPDHLASLKPTDLDLHCLQMQGISGFSRTRVKKNVLWSTLLSSFFLLLFFLSSPEPKAQGELL